MAEGGKESADSILSRFSNTGCGMEGGSRREQGGQGGEAAGWKGRQEGGRRWHLGPLVKHRLLITPSKKNWMGWEGGKQVAAGGISLAGAKEAELAHGGCTQALPYMLLSQCGCALQRCRRSAHLQGRRHLLHGGQELWLVRVALLRWREKGGREEGSREEVPVSCQELVGAGYTPTLRPERHAREASENQVCAAVMQTGAAATASRLAAGAGASLAQKRGTAGRLGAQTCPRSPGPAPARPGGPCW